jgi:molybdenum cofactor cytidylyltransferase
MPPVRHIALGAVILAAGRSFRMGCPKMLLPWGPGTVLEHLVSMWKRLPAKQIGVVCALGDAGIETELDRIRFSADLRILNPTPEHGMFSSIQCAARWDRWRKTLSHWAIVLGDQPHLQPATLKALIRAGIRYPEQICQPSRKGRPRHPVLLPKRIFSRLAVSRAGTLKEFLQPMSNETQRIELDDAGLDVDLDYPEDYWKALEQFLKPGAAMPARSGLRRSAKELSRRRRAA